MKNHEIKTRFEEESKKSDKLKFEIQKLQDKKAAILEAVPGIQQYWDLKRSLAANLPGSGRSLQTTPREPNSTVARGIKEIDKLDRQIKRRETSMRESLEKISHLKLEAALKGIVLTTDAKPDTEVPAAQPHFMVLDTKRYMTILFEGSRYDLGEPQGKAIKLLHMEGLDGHPDVPTKELREVMDLPPESDLKDSFKRSHLWNALIVSKKRNTRRLSIFH